MYRTICLQHSFEWLFALVTIKKTLSKFKLYFIAKKKKKKSQLLEYSKYHLKAMHTEAFQDHSYLPQTWNETKLSELQLPYEVKLVGFFFFAKIQPTPIRRLYSAL